MLYCNHKSKYFRENCENYRVAYDHRQTLHNVSYSNLAKYFILVTSEHSEPNDYNIRIDVFDGSYWKPGSLYRHHS